MPSTYTVNLGIEKPATGEQSGTWGDTTNTNFDILDQAINGAVRVTLTGTGTSGSPNQIQITDGATSDGRNKWIEIYSASDLGGPSYVELFPNDAEKILFIRNSLGGNQSILLFQGTYDAARDLEVPAGVDMVVKFDGTGASTATVTDVYTKLRVTELTTPTLTATSLTSTSLTATSADINGGTVDNSVIGGATPAAITGTTITANTSLNIAGDGATVTGIKDEDNMASNSATKLATQQSIKAYVDSQVSTVDTWSEVLANGATSGATSPEVTAGQVLKTDTINETSVGSGVTIDSVLLKDDVVNATDVEVGSISANDGTQAATIANTTGVMTIASSVLTSADINGGSIDGTTIGATTPAAATFTQANFGDNAKAIFGAGSDLEIYHSGTASIIRDSGVGNLSLQAEDFSVQSSDGLSTHIFVDTSTGYTSLGFGGSVKLNTSSTGVDVSGILDATSGFQFGSSDNYLYQSGTDEVTLRVGTRPTYFSFHDLGVSTGVRFNSTSTPLYLGAGQNNHVKISAAETVINEDAGTMDFRVESNNIANMLFVDGSADRVGIGTNAPGSALHVSASSPRITLTDTDTGADHYINADSSVGNLSFDIDVNSETTSPAAVWNLKGTERMRLTTAGRLGIGTSSPASLLHIASTGEAKLTIEGDSNNDAGEEAALLSITSDGGNVGHSIGIEQGTDNDLVIASGEGSASNISSGISFKTKTTGTTTPVEHMYINSTGAVAIGHSAPLGDLHIKSGASGAVTPSSVADELVLESASSGGLTIATENTNGVGSIYFANSDSNAAGRIRYFNSSDFMTFNTNGTERLRLSTNTMWLNAGQNDTDFRLDYLSNSYAIFMRGSDGKVAMGHNLPQGQLHVQSGASGGTSINASADDLVVESSTSGGITILTPNTLNGNIAFADPDDNDVGIITYQHGANAMTFTANTNEFMRGYGNIVVFNEFANDLDFRIESTANTHAFILDASQDSGQGRVGIRTSAPSGPLDVRADSNSSARITTLGKIVVECGSIGDHLRLSHIGAGLTETTASSYMTLGFGTSLGSFTRMGYFGYGSTSGTTWNWVNEIDGADTRIYTQDSSGNGISHLRLSENEINFNVDQIDLDFRVESDTNANALFVRASDSRVGINQSNPQQALDVSGNVTANAFIAKSSTFTTTTDFEILGNGVIRSEEALYLAGGSSAGSNGIFFGTKTVADSTGGWDADITQRMHIRNDGDIFISADVGIGVSSPTQALDVSGSIKASGDVNITGRIGATDGGYGTSGQILSSTGTGTDWIDAAGSYTLPEATSTTRGGIELFSDTDQTVAANAVSATAGRTYGVQLNSAGQAVVNVPWVNTNSGGTVTGSGSNDRVAVWSGSSSLDSSSNLTFNGTTLSVSQLSKGSGTFNICHPLKPDTHRLVHSFIEGPQADNLYRGQATLVGGSATVNIDTEAGMTEGTFVALNRDVQCFVSNESGWTAVKGSVSGNILTIMAQDSACTDTISWLVIGERQDQHMYESTLADENGKIIVEPLIS